MIDKDAEKRRVADVVSQIESVKMDARLQLVGIMITSFVFLGGIVIYMAKGEAKDLFDSRITKVETKIEVIEKNINEIRIDQKEILNIIRKN